jgi:hypothetical protein
LFASDGAGILNGRGGRAAATRGDTAIAVVAAITEVGSIMSFSQMERPLGLTWGATAASRAPCRRGVADLLVSIKEEQHGLSVQLVIREALATGKVPEGLQLAPSTVHRLLSRGSCPASPPALRRASPSDG